MLAPSCHVKHKNCMHEVISSVIFKKRIFAFPFHDFFFTLMLKEAFLKLFSNFDVIGHFYLSPGLIDSTVSAQCQSYLGGWFY